MPDPERWARGGFHVLRGFVSPAEQRELAEASAEVASLAPSVTPVMRDGTPFRCETTGAGAGVFHSTRGRGYHYTRTHPVTARRYPPVPDLALETYVRAMVLTGGTWRPADSVLINRYDGDRGQNLGLHNDRDEEDLDNPIVTISLGADCEFMIGGFERGDRVDTVILSSGDVVVMADAARLWFHGVKRVMPVMFSPLEHGVRLCLSLRRVYAAGILDGDPRSGDA